MFLKERVTIDTDYTQTPQFRQFTSHEGEFIFQIDNINIYINGPEVPIMDSSSKPFVELIEQNGIEIQNKKRKILKVKREIYVSNTKGSVKLIPNNQFSIYLSIFQFLNY